MVSSNEVSDQERTLRPLTTITNDRRQQATCQDYDTTHPPLVGSAGGSPESCDCIRAVRAEYGGRRGPGAGKATRRATCVPVPWCHHHSSSGSPGPQAPSLFTPSCHIFSATLSLGIDVSEKNRRTIFLQPAASQSGPAFARLPCGVGSLCPLHVISMRCDVTLINRGCADLAVGKLVVCANTPAKHIRGDADSVTPASRLSCPCSTSPASLCGTARTQY